MADITLKSESRIDGGSRPAGRLRRSGRVPAVVYGLGTDTVAISVPAHELGQILSGEAGANSLITLRVDGSDVLTLPRQIQRHPTRGDLVHVDFIRIRRDVAVSAEVPIHLTGEATGVRDGGLLEQLIFNLTVEAMPGNIPVAIELDVTNLSIGDQLRVVDLTLGTDVATEVDEDAVVAQVTAPRVAVEEVPAEGEEGEAPAEGPEAAPTDGGGDGE